jgi:hypothetical protein
LKIRETGENMSDTIELLEAIGRDATLRHASAEELAHALEHAQASEALKAAIASGDSSRLCEELGHKRMEVPHTQGPGHEEEEPDHDEDDNDDPQHPVTPDRDKPPLPD